MAPPKPNPPDPYEQKYAIIRLKELVEDVMNQAARNAEEIQHCREDILVIKTQRTFFTALAVILSSTASAILVKLFVH